MDNQSSRNDSRYSQSMNISKHKLVFLGDQSVGKTSIINRYIFDVFDDKSTPTIGIDFISKTMNLEDRSLRLQLWDTAGQERFRTLIPSYIRDSSVAAIVFDVTKQSSFDSIEGWFQDVRQQRGEEALVVFIGNKTDLADQRQVSTEQAMEKAKNLNVIYIEVSAKNGNNISELFKNIASRLPNGDLSQFVQTEKNQNPNANDQKEKNIKLTKNEDNDKQNQKGACC